MATNKYEEAMQLLASGMNVCAIGRQLGIPESTIRGWRGGKKPSIPAAVSAPTGDSRVAALEMELSALRAQANRPAITSQYQPPPQSDERSLWLKEEAENAERIKRALERGLFTLDLSKETKPIAITFISDQHISFGNLVDMRRMREDAELIAATDGCYAMLGGDAVDNHCLDDKTELLTQRGWMSWWQIEPTDKAFGINLETNKGEWQSIGKVVVSNDYDGELVRIETESVDLLCTTGHRVLAKIGETAAHAAEADFFFTTADSMKSRRWLPVSSPSSQPEWSGATDDELRLVGWVLTDGWIGHGRGRQRYFVAQRESNADQIRCLLDSLGYEFSVYRKLSKAIMANANLGIATAEDLLTFSIRAKHSDRIKELLPTKAALPQWVSLLSDRQFRVFLATIIEGDGSHNGNAWVLYGKQAFLEQMQAACITHGLRASIRSVSGRTEKRLLIAPATMQQVWPKRVSRQSYQGTVWCLQVQHENFAVRRNGKVCITGNCKHRAAIIAARSTPGDQYKAFNWYLQIFAPRIACMVTGNHDYWTAQFAGIDMIDLLAQQNRIAYSPFEAYVNCKFSGHEFLIGLRHKYRLNSSFNQGHAPKQWHRNGERMCDLYCIGDHHDPHVEITRLHGLERGVCRPGSYQITSAYAGMEGWNSTIPTCPTWLVWPNERRFVGFHDMRTGLEVLKMYRGK